MNIDAKCRVCAKPLCLQVDDCYAVSDPMRLVPMATCNRCYDLRDRRERLHEKIYRICATLATQPNMSMDARDASRKKLTAVLKQYMEYLKDFNRLSGDIWDDVFVESLMQHPERWQFTLREVRANVRQVAKDAWAKQPMVDA